MNVGFFFEGSQSSSRVFWIAGFIDELISLPPIVIL
jgi:hypothetical protein